MSRIEVQTHINAPIERVFELARDIDFHQRSMSRSHERAIAGRTSGLIRLGETVTWRARHLGLTWSLTSRITAFDSRRGFVDEQVRGPFASFRHEHRFEPTADGTLMTDVWQHRAPLGLLGKVADRLVLERVLRRLIQERNAALVREAEGWRNLKGEVDQ